MTQTLAQCFGRLIRETRQAQGLRLVDLSRLSGVALATLSDLENGTRDTRLSSYQRVFDALGITMATLLASQADTTPGLAGGAGGYDLGDAL